MGTETDTFVLYDEICYGNQKNAFELIEQNYTHEQLICMLKNGDIAERQLAALLITQVDNSQQALILSSNLVGQNGKVREASSYKVNYLMNDESQIMFFKSKEIYRIFLDAIIDINGNICRNIISAVCKLKNNHEFIEYFCHNLIKMTNNFIEIIKDFDFKDGKYKVNKEVFKLYWCLETLYEFTDYIESSVLKNILLKTVIIDEYTIREKTAKILSKGFDDNDLLKIKEQLRQDKNYYVRSY